MPSRANAAGEGRAPGGFAFYLLVLMGLSTFAPCILLPEWRKLEAIDLAAQLEQHELGVLQSRIEAQQRLVTAIRSDPVVMARLAQRELNVRLPGTKHVRVSAGNGGLRSAGGREHTFVPTQRRLPRPVERFCAALPQLNYDALFCDPEIRPILMIMSVGLIALAFALFRSRESTS